MTSLPNKDLLRPDEAAKYFSVTTKTIYVWIHDGKLEAVKIAGTVTRIKRESCLKCQELIQE
jgi:excisionase family DNA binding protein